MRRSGLLICGPGRRRWHQELQKNVRKIFSNFLADTCLPVTPSGESAAGRRFRVLAPDELDDAQKKSYDSIASGPRGGVSGPFNALLRSPELADRAQALGEYLRFNTSLPARLNEFADRKSVV